ncbi:MAG: MBL fold metallo-hydrolase [Candidatus Krumholzibacteriia bacterium]
MKIGSWQADGFVSGRFGLDGGAMFGVVPKNIWSRVAPADDQNRIAMATRLLLIRGRGKTVVVDSGCGMGYSEKLARIYAFEATVPMTDCLRQYDLRPQDVTDVLVTHLHFDHGGGLATPDGSGWRLTFPDAAHHIQRRQWQHALNPNPRDRASFFGPRIKIIEREGNLVLHDGDWSLDEGVDLHTFDGHTPGQHLPRLHDNETTLFFCGDLVPTSAHLPVPYIMSYDLQPVLAMEEKTRMLEKAAREGWTLFFEHDPKLAACVVRDEGGRYTAGEAVEV